jgi:ABC-2 type transport system permease protein
VNTAKLPSERLSLPQAAFTVARRDFTAILFSRSFIFFLLGPLFPVIVFMLAGGIGQRVAAANEPPAIGIAMTAEDAEAMIAAYRRIEPQVGGVLPQLKVIENLEPGTGFDARFFLEDSGANYAAVVSGTPAAPRLTAPHGRLERYAGPVSLVAATALARAPPSFPEVEMVAAATSAPNLRTARLQTAQGAETVLFLLIMLLSGMVLSNLVEEKANKIIEILAAAIPMDAVFLGKLFAMLAISLVGVTVWGTTGALIVVAGGEDGMIAQRLAALTPPGVGWPLFFGFGVLYFSMGYLLLGSIFLAIGSLATTVREVQTMSMPVTMGQVLVFFLASLGLAETGGTLEWIAILFPLSSPYAMLGRAAQDGDLWPHLLAICWQIAWVLTFIHFGANLFRKRVMQSGPKRAKRSLFARRKPERA